MCPENFLFLTQRNELCVCYFNVSQLPSPAVELNHFFMSLLLSTSKNTSRAGEDEIFFFLAGDGEREMLLIGSVNFLCFGGLSVASS